MKRSYFLKQLIALPFGPYVAQKFFLSDRGSQYLLNKFYVAGFQYYDGPVLIENISAADELTLLAEPENPHDKFAVAIYRKNVMLGHVPRTDNKHISRLLQQGAELVCKVTKSNPEEEMWHMLRVEIYLQS